MVITLEKAKRTGILLLCLTLASPALSQESKFDGEKERNFLFASRFTYVYRSSRTFTDFVKKLGSDLKKEDGDYLSKLASGVKIWPQVNVDGNAIRIQYDRALVFIKVMDLAKKELLINNFPFTLDATKPIEKELHRLAEVLKAKPRPKTNVLQELFMSTAHAIDPMSMLMTLEGNSAIGTHLLTGSSLAESTQTSLLLGGSATASSGGAAAGAGAAGGLGVLATTGIVLGAVAIAYVGGCAIYGLALKDGKSGEFGRQWANCLSSPLNLVSKDANPRNWLHLTDINCDSNASGSSGAFTVTLRSSTGSEETRKFEFNNRILNRVEARRESNENFGVTTGGIGNYMNLTFDKDGKKVVKAEDSRGREPITLVSPADDQQLRNMSQIAQDFDYYRGICSDPARLNAFRAVVKDGGTGERGTTLVPEKSIH